MLEGMKEDVPSTSDFSMRLDIVLLVIITFDDSFNFPTNK